MVLSWENKDGKNKTKYNCFTLNFEKSFSEAILQASFLFWPVAEAVSDTLSPLTLTSTENSLVSFNDTDGSSNSKLWAWQSSRKSLIGLNCKLDENFMIGSKNEVMIFQTLFKLNPESRRMAPTQDSTKSPSAWSNQWCQIYTSYLLMQNNKARHTYQKIRRCVKSNPSVLRRVTHDLN